MKKVTAGYMKEKAGLKTTWQIRDIIAVLRLAGMPVCAENDGYYLPRCKKELTDYIKKFDKRINLQVKALVALDEFAKNKKSVYNTGA